MIRPIPENTSTLGPIQNSDPVDIPEISVRDTVRKINRALTGSQNITVPFFERVLEVIRRDEELKIDILRLLHRDS